MKKKRLKLKKWVYVVLIIVVLGTVGIIYGIRYYNDYLYKQTNEYKLLQIGYPMEEIKTIYDKGNEEIVNELLGKDYYDESVIKLLNEKYFLLKNYDKYREYMEEEDKEELSKVVTLVNTYAVNKWYEVELNTDSSKKELMLVNKFYGLDESYEPEELVNIPLQYAYGKEGENKLISYAYEAFLEMWNDASEAGHTLMVNSSFRTHEEQKSLYDAKAKAVGERKADETAARPGHSEHQTGLVVDMTSKDAPSSKDFASSESYAWLKENAYKYGFIERYPEGKTYITGYSPESWHWRYVGKSASKVIHDEDITFDEYYAYYVEGN